MAQRLGAWTVLLLLFREALTLRPVLQKGPAALSFGQTRGVLGRLRLNAPSGESWDGDVLDPRERDALWLREANSIEYVVGGGSNKDFGSLASIGLNISSELSSRNIIPHHLTTASDLFCNRELNMKQVDVVGFDMDWTLAQYNLEFDLLAFNGATEKLVRWLGYPEEVLNFTYTQDYCRRGCIIDKKRGNILKLDQHNYVRVAEHGLTQLTSQERKQVYRQKYHEMQAFSGSNFATIDTPFSLVDAALFVQLVDLRDQYLAVSETDPTSPMAFSPIVDKSYLQLWLDMRRCVDRCHKDGVIKNTVAQNPAKYITYDPNIFPMLRSFREAGKKTFLLTNSLWDYTVVVMNYLEGRKSGAKVDLKWANFFDIVIVGGNKPAFLVDERGSLALFRLDSSTGGLQNVENLPRTEMDAREFLAEGKYFQGGNAATLHKLLGLTSGDRLLYVGDHVYADVLRSKRSLGWRTCLIVPELTGEIMVNKRMRDVRNQIVQLRNLQFVLENQKDALEHLNSDEVDAQELDLDRQLSSVRAEMQTLITSFNAAFHPRWGPLFRAGFQESRFAKQISDYACMYTSRASNLGLVSPLRPFRPIRDRLPHDHFLEEYSVVDFENSNGL